MLSTNTITAHYMSLDAADFNVIPSAKAFKNAILEHISNAKKRIYITALYLQEDDAGREILNALYCAKQNRPELNIKIFVDAHRAQRGLIGDPSCEGNQGFYRKIAEQFPFKIDIYGVLVKTKELFGVLHLKGLIFDETVIYTGASINDVYLHQGEKCRFDRYHILKCTDLADSMVDYLHRFIINPGFSPLLNITEQLDKKIQKKFAKKQKALLKKSNYSTQVHSDKAGKIKVTPMVGFGARGNSVNNCIRELFKTSRESLVLFTPYFNLPAILAKDLRKTLLRGVKVTMVIGDKTANDFFIPEDQEFSKIGIIPYIYEILLVRFIKRNQHFIDSGLLNVHLWTNSNHSFHLKGVVADNQRHLITGNNLNPRAWSLDLENALLLDDPQHLLSNKWQVELQSIMDFTRRVQHSSELQSLADYPKHARDPIRKLQLSQIDRLLKRFM
ncbi:MAG: CDP-diacylglycerol--serine O-phosphatidyltransferase [Pseudomonadales bacterium]|nr:CDP-diacylglycerol--serine O-phosphatidyltransferase [Pseudomonadales bacterium]NRA18595.1 CDP-diacylglycerol--serine O-phosphatidyltransferase [Oceanospirillaceae bacterium]